jgi:hypothetical protein
MNILVKKIEKELFGDLSTERNIILELILKVTASELDSFLCR